MTLKLFLVALFTDVTMGRYSAGTELCLSSLTQVFNIARSPTLPSKGHDERQDVWGSPIPCMEPGPRFISSFLCFFTHLCTYTCGSCSSL